jgi:carbon-monoxide dehydrogenase large subunit
MMGYAAQIPHADRWAIVLYLRALQRSQNASLDDIPPGSDEPTAEPLLATDRVRYVGESVALVLTEHGSQGEDAAELVSVDYEPLPAVVSLDDALAGHTLLFPGTTTNVVNSGGDPAPADAFSGCDVVIERTFPNQRVAPVPLEVRAAAARWADGRLTVWASTQNAQLARDAVAGAVGLEPGAVRVIAPDVGGGFGAKIAVERDTLVIAWAARRVGRPVRWVGDAEREPAVHGARPGQRHAITIGGTRTAASSPTTSTSSRTAGATRGSARSCPR